MTTGVLVVGARIKFNGRMLCVRVRNEKIYACAFPDVREIGAWAFLKFIEFLELGSGPGPPPAARRRDGTRHGAARRSKPEHQPPSPIEA